MIVDSSAIIAVLDGEGDAVQFETALAMAASVKISAGTLLETAIVVDRRGRPEQSRLLDTLIRETPIAVVSVDHRQVIAARRAHAEYGKGSGSPARLNFGDCFAYALAMETGEALLYKGNDFGHTDIRSATVD